MHVLSHMAARGSQVFDVMLVTDTEAGHCGVGMREHVVRFLRSAELMGMEQVGEAGDIEAAIAATVAANIDDLMRDAERPAPLVVKMIAAWTEDAIGLMPADLRPTVYVLVWCKDGAGASSVMKDPVKVASTTIPKIPAEVLPPSLKVAASYTPGVRAQLAARADGFDHVVFRTTDGDLAESTTLSLMVVSDGRIVVPPLDTVLDGITRRLVLDAAQSIGIPIEVRGVYWDEVTGADELFLCSTNQPVLPVGLLDERSFDAPGAISRRLAEVVSEIYAGRHQLSSRWLTQLSKSD